MAVRLKRRVSLRDSYLKKLKENGTRFLFAGKGKLSRKRPMKKVSRSQRTRLQHYYVLSTEFLKRDENRLCQICTRRREAGENIVINAATEVHHFAGRNGRLLCYVPYFIASCYQCRLWPHEHPAKSREMRLLAPANLWGCARSD